MNVFLTGGTGFIGLPLVKQLIQRGWTVCALVRNPDSKAAKALQTLGCNLSRGDVTEREAMRDGMRGADIVIHNAGVYEYGVAGDARRKMYDINVNGTENVLSLAHELKIPRVLYVSTTWSEGETGSEVCDETFRRNTPYKTYYEETKALAHQIAERYRKAGLPVMTARPNGVIGTNDHSVLGYFVRMYINHMMPPYAWSPDSVFSFVHVDDLAEGLALAAEKGRVGEDYLFCGEPLKQREMISFWNEQQGGMKVRFYIPTALMSFMVMPLAPLLRLLGLPAFLSPEAIRVGSSTLNYSSQKAQKELGWKHRSAREAWKQIFDEEIALRRQRSTRNPIKLLKLVE